MSPAVGELSWSLPASVVRQMVEVEGEGEVNVWAGAREGVESTAPMRLRARVVRESRMRWVLLQAQAEGWGREPREQESDWRPSACAPPLLPLRLPVDA